MTEKTGKPNNIRVWLALAAFAALLFFAARLSTVISDVEYEAFNGQWQEKIRTLNMIIDEVDTYVAEDDDWLEYDYLEHLNPMIIDMDDNPGVFTAVYSANLEPMSERMVIEGEAPFDPRVDPDFEDYVRMSERGVVNVKYASATNHFNYVRLYFRWFPTGCQYNDRMLAMVAMWPGAMDAHPTAKLVSWCVGLLALAVLEMVMVVFALIPRRGKTDEGKR